MPYKDHEKHNEPGTYTPPEQSAGPIIVTSSIIVILACVAVYFFFIREPAEGEGRTGYKQENVINFYDMHVALYFTNHVVDTFQIFVDNTPENIRLTEGTFSYQKCLFNKKNVSMKRDLASYVYKYEVLRTEEIILPYSKYYEYKPRKFDLGSSSTSSYYY